MAVVPSILLTIISLQSCQQKKEATDLLSDSYIEVEGDSVKDFGTYQASKGEQKLARFVIRNVGTDPLVIQHINTGCGCTTVSFRKSPIMPDDTTHIIVKFEGTGLAYGSFYKEISVTSNARSGLLRLAIKGTRQE